jgi:hypothetical protein
MKQPCIICKQIYNIYELQPHYVVEHNLHITPQYHDILHMINHIDLYNDPVYYYTNLYNTIPYNNVCCRMINMAIYNNKPEVIVQLNSTYHYIDLINMKVELDNNNLFYCIPVSNIFCLEHNMEKELINNDYPLRSIYMHHINNKIIMNKNINSHSKSA